MTREEAAKWLMRIKEKYIHGGDEAFDARRREALDMATEALETISSYERTIVQLTEAIANNAREHEKVVPLSGEYVRKTDAINEVNNAIAKYIPLLHGSLEKIPLDAARAIKRMKGDQVIKVLNKTPAQ